MGWRYEVESLVVVRMKWVIIKVANVVCVWAGFFSSAGLANLTIILSADCDYSCFLAIEVNKNKPFTDW